MSLNIGYLSSNKTDNELYTPFYAVDPIIKYLPKDKVIWCPFDEEWSAFYIRLKELGYKTIRSSLKNEQDFFKYEPLSWDIIISNPPFSIKDKVIDRLYSFNKPFAVLLPLNSLQGKTRYKYFKQGIQLLSFDSRICYHNPNSMKIVFLTIKFLYTINIFNITFMYKQFFCYFKLIIFIYVQCPCKWFFPNRNKI